MSKAVLGGLFVLVLQFCSSVAWTAGPPVMVTHKLTGYTKAENLVALDFAIRVKNLQNKKLADVSLAFVPSPPFVAERTILTIPAMAPGESVELPLHLKVPAAVSQVELARKQIFWNGRYVDENGEAIEFPATSRAGGGR